MSELLHFPSTDRCHQEEGRSADKRLSSYIRSVHIIQVCFAWKLGPVCLVIILADYRWIIWPLIMRFLLTFSSRGQSNEVPATEGQHYCVDENTERRNHYLDLAGIENYTSRFEGKCLYFCLTACRLDFVDAKGKQQYSVINHIWINH